MTKTDLTKLTNQELQVELKKRKTSFQSLLIIVFIMVLISIYTTVRNGFGFFTFFPLVWVFITLATWNNYQEAIKEIQSRKL